MISLITIIGYVLATIGLMYLWWNSGTSGFLALVIAAMNGVFIAGIIKNPTSVDVYTMLMALIYAIGVSILCVSLYYKRVRQ